MRHTRFCPQIPVRQESVRQIFRARWRKVISGAGVVPVHISPVCIVPVQAFRATVFPVYVFAVCLCGCLPGGVRSVPPARGRIKAGKHRMSGRRAGSSLPLPCVTAHGTGPPLHTAGAALSLYGLLVRPAFLVVFWGRLLRLVFSGPSFQAILSGHLVRPSSLIIFSGHFLRPSSMVRLFRPLRPSGYEPAGCFRSGEHPVRFLPQGTLRWRQAIDLF